jgi:hypothetical protein
MNEETQAVRPSVSVRYYPFIRVSLTRILMVVLLIMLRRHPHNNYYQYIRNPSIAIYSKPLIFLHKSLIYRGSGCFLLSSETMV